MAKTAASMERGVGVALWRQIADRIRQGVSDGTISDGDRLPPEVALAQRFGVNRHTVRSAIAALVQEGVLRAEQGRGTFVRRTPRISYAIGRHTRFSANLDGQARAARGRLLAHATVPAEPAVAAALALPPSAPVIRLDIVGEADGMPVSRATSWFDAGRFPSIAQAYGETGSMTAALARHGVDDYVRRSTTVSARHADPAVLAELALSPGAIVLVAAAIDEDSSGRPIQYVETRFPADRVELTIA